MVSTYFFKYIGHFSHISILCSGQIMALSISRICIPFSTAMPSFMLAAFSLSKSHLGSNPISLSPWNLLRTLQSDLIFLSKLMQPILPPLLFGIFNFYLIFLLFLHLSFLYCETVASYGEDSRVSSTSLSTWYTWCLRCLLRSWSRLGKWTDTRKRKR